MCMGTVKRCALVHRAAECSEKRVGVQREGKGVVGYHTLVLRVWGTVGEEGLLGVGLVVQCVWGAGEG